MQTESTDIILQNKVFIWVALAVLFILLIPLTAMQFTNNVNWDETDFIVMGALLFSTGSMFVLAARKIRKYRAILVIIIAAAFLYIWAELAVGIFTNLGS